MSTSQEFFKVKDRVLRTGSTFVCVVSRPVAEGCQWDMFLPTEAGGGLGNWFLGVFIRSNQQIITYADANNPDGRLAMRPPGQTIWAAALLIGQTGPIPLALALSETIEQGGLKIAVFK